MLSEDVLRENIIFKKHNILVAGDVMLDRYCIGKVERISPEAPVPVLKKTEEREVPGGAANVCANLAAAGQKVSLMSVIGNDEAGEKLLSLLSKMKIDADLVLQLKKPTTVKTRFLADNNQQILRVDTENTEEIKKKFGQSLLQRFEIHVNEYDIVLLSDYLKGFFSEQITQGIIEVCKKNNIKVCIDGKDKNYRKYRGAFLLKPNKKELSDMLGRQCRTLSEVIIGARELCEKADVKYVLVTMGDQGMALVGSDGGNVTISAHAKAVFDVTGAGDTTISYLVAGLANGFAIEDAAEIANVAAAIEVGKVGTSRVTLPEVNEFLNKNFGKKQKIISVMDLKKEIKDYHSNRIVFTNGCFDILHVGHVEYLQKAKELGDVLIVAVNDDDSVRRLKGGNRPVNTLQDRMQVLAGLSCVDYVVSFSEDTPYELIKKIRPGILVKGEDYKNKEVVGTDIVESYGGRVVLLPFVQGHSTTHIIEKIKDGGNK